MAKEPTPNGTGRVHDAPVTCAPDRGESERSSRYLEECGRGDTTVRVTSNHMIAIEQRGGYQEADGEVLFHPSDIPTIVTWLNECQREAAESFEKANRG